MHDSSHHSEKEILKVFILLMIAEDSATGLDCSAAILEALEILLALVTLRHAAQLIVGLELRAGVKSALGLNCPHVRHSL
jgi:hypothetical protein